MHRFINKYGYDCFQINFSSDKLREYLSYGLKNSSGINRNKSIYIDEESIEPKFINVSFANESEMNNLEDEWIIERHTLISFAHVTTGFHENSIQILLSRLEHLILPNPPARHGLFHQINDLSKVRLILVLPVTRAHTHKLLSSFDFV